MHDDLTEVRGRDADLGVLCERGSLFAILDACGAPAVPGKVRLLGLSRAVSLYRGRAEEDYFDIAPYLVKVDQELVEWIKATLGDEPWGIYLESGAEVETLRTHFRRFLTVKSPEGERMYFRFYDPRVLPKFLETCTVEELHQVFGPVVRFGIPMPQDSEVLFIAARTTLQGSSPDGIRILFKKLERPQ